MTLFLWLVDKQLRLWHWIYMGLRYDWMASHAQSKKVRAQFQGAGIVVLTLAWCLSTNVKRLEHSSFHPIK
jgi:hypothetical protein